MMSTIRKALLTWLLAAFVGFPLAAQLTDCAFTRTFTGDLNAASSSNISGNTPCVNWRVTYSVTGSLTSTVTFQTSPDNTNWTSVPNTICSSTVQPPCVLQGTNPLTGTTQGMSLFSAYGAYVRVITSGSAGTGTGTIRGYGAKGATAAVSGGNSVGGGNVTSTGGLTVDAVILGNGGLDIKAGAVLPGDPAKFYDGTGAFSVMPSAGTLIYYYSNTASGIATYLQATQLPFSPKTTLSFAALATGTDALQNWATNAGSPGLTFIPQGIYNQHIHALRTGGGVVTLHTEFWEVDSAGVDIAMIGVTNDTAALTAAEIQYDMDFASSAPYILASTASRIVGRVFAVVGGSAPTVQIFVGGTADTRLGLPSNTVDATNFVPYTGATANLDLASHDLLLTGTSGQVSLRNGALLKPCVVIIGDPGAASPVLANDNDSPVACGNSWGSDWKIQSVACWANTGSPTVTPILTAGSATSILTGALTCGTAAWAPGTVNATPIVHTFSANGSTCAATPCTIDVNITTAGGAAKYIVVRIVGTL